MTKPYNKQAMIGDVAVRAGLTKQEARDAIDAVFESIIKAVQNDYKVQIIDFGSFEKHHRGSRKGRNPQTGEDLIIPESVYPTFKPGKGFKDAVKE